MSVYSRPYTEREGSEITVYPDFAIEYRDASHSYWIHAEERERVPSVTGVLKVLDKPALLMWAERAGAEGAARLAQMGELGDDPAEAINLVRLHKLGMAAKRDAGADRGTIVHRVLEAYSREQTIPNIVDFEAEHRGFVQGLCKWLLKSEPTPVLIEQVVGSVKHGYAGRVDLVAEIEGRLTLTDLKTNPAGRCYDEGHLQAAAYALALPECGLPEPERCIVVAVGAQGSFEEVECEAGPLDFLSVLETSKRMARLKTARIARERAMKAALNG